MKDLGPLMGESYVGDRFEFLVGATLVGLQPSDEGNRLRLWFHLGESVTVGKPFWPEELEVEEVVIELRAIPQGCSVKVAIPVPSGGHLEKIVTSLCVTDEEMRTFESWG